MIRVSRLGSDDLNVIVSLRYNCQNISKELIMEALGADTSWKMLILALVLAVIGVIAVKVRFDINRWQEKRHERQQQKLKMLCTHTAIEGPDERGQFSVQSYFIKPRMTWAWVCSRCGRQAAGEQAANRVQSYWIEHPTEWAKAEKKFIKQARKLGYL